ncbi:hypothetical protein BDV95DRAFT_380891 [Massariosphaeria phaeospora]|uniref:Rhodopsin domain-containing protein n=1 Tax=Massariosphaeria phaeospora TaxID=100035 RepID=A0A7C8MD21_9PLEO|nr:hypothetical protein BDV95DRAFT_380891 [Massariosphaeria phaeospora]
MPSADLLRQLLANPPDPFEPLPLSNRKETIYGSIIPFTIVAWIAVVLRLNVRFRVLREPGWDDFFVVLSAICMTVATVTTLRAVTYGLGKHFIYIGLENTSSYLLSFYISNSMYITNTALIKISLLLQYLRIFKAGTMRWVCLALLGIISLWGIAYSFMSWFPCFPPSLYWDSKLATNTCYGYGFKDTESFVAIYMSHTVLNMAFDIAVFLTPMVLFREPNLRKKNVLAMTGVFLFGAVVVFTSIWRLYTISSSRAPTHPYIDFTWWSPISIILSSLEIDLAIMCASIPIFWPVIEKSLAQIFVTREVRVTEHRRLDDEQGLAYELEHNHKMGMERSASLKSDGGQSRESLTREVSHSSGNEASVGGGRGGGDDLGRHYKDHYVVAQVDPLALENGSTGMRGIETNVNSGPKPKWRL